MQNICITSERNNCSAGLMEKKISHVNLVIKKLFNKLKTIKMLILN